MVLGLVRRLPLQRGHRPEGTIRGQRASPPGWMLLGRGYQVPVCGEELGSAGGYLLLPGISGGVGDGEVRGVSVAGLERGNLLFLDCAWNFDETAHHSIKRLIGSQKPDIIQLRVEASLCDRLHWCGLLGLG
jgi:hypothetical protein